MELTLTPGAIVTGPDGQQYEVTKIVRSFVYGCAVGSTHVELVGFVWVVSVAPEVAAA